MDQTQGEYLVLYSDLGREDFVRVAEGRGWIKEKTREGDGDKVSYQEIWTTPDRTGVVNYVDDPLSGTRFLWLHGAGMDQILREIAARLPCYDQEDLLDLAAQPEDHDEAVQAVMRIAVGFPRFDPRALRVFEIYLQHPSPLLRRATIQAIAYRRWPEGLPLLEKVAQEDPDEAVRAFARRVLDQEPAAAGA